MSQSTDNNRYGHSKNYYIEGERTEVSIFLGNLRFWIEEIPRLGPFELALRGRQAESLESRADLILPNSIPSLADIKEKVTHKLIIECAWQKSRLLEFGYITDVSYYFYAQAVLGGHVDLTYVSKDAFIQFQRSVGILENDLVKGKTFSLIYCGKLI